MDALKSMKISASGLSAQRKRIETISSNIANAQVTRTADGTPYQRKEVILAAEPQREKFSDILEGELGEHTQGVYVKEIVSDKSPFQMVYKPEHPDANENGMVAMPNVNVVTEMADLMSAQRSYEANINAINTSKSMAMKALDLGKN